MGGPYSASVLAGHRTTEWVEAGHRRRAGESVDPPPPGQIFGGYGLGTGCWAIILTSTIQRIPMARPRLPAKVAEATGADGKNPGRFKGRSSPKVDPLGAAPRGFTKEQREAWAQFADEMPWLGKSDRTVVEVASRLRAAMTADPLFPMAGFAQLRMCLSSMGGTPSDRTKVPAPNEEEADPSDEYLN